MPPPVTVNADLLPSWAIVKPKRLEHIRRVAALLEQWSAAMSLPAAERERWQRAGWMHDALREAPLEQLRLLVPGCDWDEELLHGPAAANRALTNVDADVDADAWRDPEVLLAVRWHSVGCADWGLTGRALYCADFLDPERKFDRDARTALARRFPKHPDAVFREVVVRRVRWTERSGWPLLDETRRLWHSLQ